jgi:hypothetical protein
MIAAAMYVPRHFGTHADPNKAAFPTKTAADTSPNASTPNPPNPPATPNARTDSSQPIVNLQGPGGSLKVDANGNVSMDSPSGGMHVDAKTGAVTMTGPGGNVAVNSNKKDRASGNPVPARAGATSSDQDTNAAPVPPPGPSQEEIEKAEDEADKLNVRANSVSHSIDALRQQQNASGYNLRADIASSEERMQMYLAKGNAALKAQDLKGAQKYFDLADTECNKLEKFLGH